MVPRVVLEPTLSGINRPLIHLSYRGAICLVCRSDLRPIGAVKFSGWTVVPQRTQVRVPSSDAFPSTPSWLHIAVRS